MTAETNGERGLERGFERSLLARAGVTAAVFGFFVFLLALFPRLINFDITPGVGILQITLILIGISFVTVGAYLYTYATRHRARPRRLRESVGVRLMLTGLVLAYVSGLADVLGIGTHPPGNPAAQPHLGEWQAVGITLGVLVIVAGVFLYGQRPKG